MSTPKKPPSNPLEWYLPNRNGDEPLGPYTTEEVQDFLSKGQVRFNEFIWGSHYEDLRWRRISEIAEFQETVPEKPKLPPPPKLSDEKPKQVHTEAKSESKKTEAVSEVPSKEPVKAPVKEQSAEAPPSIATLPRPAAIEGKKARGESSNVFRRYPRIPMQASVIVHNGKRYAHGQCVDISERGVQVRMDPKDLFELGEEVSLTVRTKDGRLGTFSVPSVVLRFIGKGDSQNMGLFFQRLSPQIRRKIARFVISYLNAKLREQEVA